MVIGQRNWSIDLGRIAAMLMVLILHINLFGGFLSIKDHSLYYFCILFYEHIAIIAVNVFVIISAWFLCDKNITISKVVYLFVPIIFWSILLGIVTHFLGVEITKKDIFLQIPVIGSSYSFVTGYLVMFVLSPYTNVLINNLTHKRHQRLCIILLFFFSLLSPFVKCQYIDLNMGYHFFWFITLYLVTSYIRKYGLFENFTWYHFLFIYLSLSLLASICEFAGIPYIGQRPYNNPIVVICAFSFFLFFTRISIKSKVIVSPISFFAPLAFSVYLIHANRLIEQWYISQNFSKYVESWYEYIVIVPLVSAFIYLICSFLELLRIKIFHLAKIDVIINSTCKKIEVLTTKI